VPEQARAETPFGPAILVTQDPNRTSSAISRSCFIAGSGTTINPKFGSLPHWAIAASISLEPRIGAVTTSTANLGAAATAEANQLAGLASGLDRWRRARRAVQTP
jgi:hypothetical protein